MAKFISLKIRGSPTFINLDCVSRIEPCTALDCRSDEQGNEIWETTERPVMRLTLIDGHPPNPAGHDDGAIWVEDPADLAKLRKILEE